MLAILLSTYNGEEFLSEQLDSLFNQTYTNFVLYIRDDGSTDSTLKIIKYYQEKYKNIILLSNSGQNLGPCKSFMSMLQEIEASYYMFCDQDDVWLPTKIQMSLDAIKMEELRSIDLPVIVHSDLIVVDVNLSTISPSLWLHNNNNPSRVTRKYLPILNYVTGCTMLFNSLARAISLSHTDDQIMHDFWISICVDSVEGIIVSLPIPTILYRQHLSNTIGASKDKYLFPRLQRYFHIPDLTYSNRLYGVLKSKYNLSLYRYIWLRLCFYITR